MKHERDVLYTWTPCELGCVIKHLSVVWTGQSRVTNWLTSSPRFLRSGTPVSTAISNATAARCKVVRIPFSNSDEFPVEGWTRYRDTGLWIMPRQTLDTYSSVLWYLLIFRHFRGEFYVLYYLFSTSYFIFCILYFMFYILYSISIAFLFYILYLYIFYFQFYIYIFSIFYFIFIYFLFSILYLYIFYSLFYIYIFFILYFISIYFLFYIYYFLFYIYVYILYFISTYIFYILYLCILYFTIFNF